jgi:TIR domain
MFLRGAGLSNEVIAFYSSLGGAIRFYTVFISYSTRQQDFAERLYSDLQRENIRCWLATEDLKIGDPFRQTIDDAIRVHDKLLLVFSGDAVESEWVEDEVNAALHRERRRGEAVLFPITVDDAIWDTDRAWARAIREKRHIGDCRRWRDYGAYSIAFDRLLRDLRR